MSLLALIVASPMAVAAPHELLYADYEGTVTDLVPFPVGDQPHYVGEHIQGRLTIDVTLAEQIRNDPEPNFQGYSVREPYSTPDFVSGFNPFEPLGGTDDQLSVLRRDDGAGGLLDIYHINDNLGNFGHGMELGVAAHDLFDTLDIRQSFDLKASDLKGPGEGMSGTFYEGREGLASFMLSRLTLRPATCHAP